MKTAFIKTAFITGAGGYIGSCVARTLAAEGMAVMLCDIRRESALSVAEEIIAAGGKAAALEVDVTDSASVDAAVAETVRTFGGLDVSVHVAGGSARIAGQDIKLAYLTEREDFVIDRVLRVNLYGAIYVARAAARQMIAQGRGGRIVSFGSSVGINGMWKSTEYAAAKGGVIAMTKSLAKELGAHRITVNAVSPGVVERPGEEHKDDHAVRTNFLETKCTAQEIADVVAFVASEKSRFMTGHNFVVDGGRSLSLRGSEQKKTEAAK